MSLTSIDLGLLELLSDPERRQEFFRAITQDEIAEQIRALRKARGLTQNKFAALAGMKQSAVSRIEQAEYAGWTWATLCKVASPLNARWRIILEPCEEAVKEFLNLEIKEPEIGIDAERQWGSGSELSGKPLIIPPPPSSGPLTVKEPS